MSSCSDYHATRRRMLQLSGGVAGASLLGMPIRNLLAEAQSASSAKAEHVILFWLSGGISHIDTFDPKPGRPTAGDFDPIKTSADGVQISQIFPQLARQMHHASLIRSIAGSNGDHGRATYELQTSYNQSGTIVHPGLGSMVASEREQLGELPAFVSIGGNAPKAGYLGQKCEAYYVGQPGERDPYLAFPDGIHATRGNKRLDLLAQMNIQHRENLSSAEMKAAETALEDAVNLMRSPALQAFDLEKEDARTLARYGETDFGRAALLARRLVETGVRFVQVNRGGFDNHSDIFPAMTNHGLVMDPAFASLIQDLAASGLLEKTMVVVLSEFGRTPRVNDNAGRDHHARVFSALFAGGGTKGGHVVGASDEDGVYPAERPVQPSDLHATVCAALGIDHTKVLTTPDGRPMHLVKKGSEVVHELFA